LVITYQFQNLLAKVAIMVFQLQIGYYYGVQMEIFFLGKYSGLIICVP
jgi:hypothetical protein